MEFATELLNLVSAVIVTLGAIPVLKKSNVSSAEDLMQVAVNAPVGVGVNNRGLSL